MMWAWATEHLPARTRSPRTLELDFPMLSELELGSELELTWARPRRYSRWLALGLIAGSALALLAMVERAPPAAVPRQLNENRAADEVLRHALFGCESRWTR